MGIDSLSRLKKMRLKLFEKGFSQSNEDSVMCCFRYTDMKVDDITTNHRVSTWKSLVRSRL